MVSSLDILYLVIAFAVLWVAGSVCWFIWQMVIIVKELHKTVHSLTYAIENVEKAIDGIKGKFGTGKLSDHFKSTVEVMKDKMKK